MTISAFEGPLVSFGSASPQEYNPQRGPSLFDSANGIMDPRNARGYQPGAQDDSPVYGWAGWGMTPTIMDVPPALVATAIAAAQVPVAGTPMTLASSSANGILVGQSIVRTDTQATVTGLLAIENAVSTPAFGSGGTGNGGPIRIIDPTTCLARCIRLTFVGNEASATFTIRGYDIYWYPMTETITGTAPGTVNGKKAFKYIQSVTPAGTLSGSNVSVGTNDQIGLPLFATGIGELVAIYNALVALPTSFVAGDLTAPTATTGDVRGTFIPASATDGTKRLQLFQTPLVSNMVLAPTTGLVGQTQFADF